MKKIATALTALSSLFYASVAFAQSVPIGIRAPREGVNPAVGLGAVLSNALTIVFVLAALAVLFMLIWGAFQWIISGGDKEKVNSARGRITNALIGLAILALAFLIVNVVGQILHINLLTLDFIPTLDRPLCPEGEAFDSDTGRCAAR